MSIKGMAMKMVMSLFQSGRKESAEAEYNRVGEGKIEVILASHSNFSSLISKARKHDRCSKVAQNYDSALAPHWHPIFSLNVLFR